MDLDEDNAPENTVPQFLKAGSQRLNELAEERARIARHALTLRSMTSPVASIPREGDLDPARFQHLLANFPMTPERIHSLAYFDWAVPRNPPDGIRFNRSADGSEETSEIATRSQADYLGKMYGHEPRAGDEPTDFNSPEYHLRISLDPLKGERSPLKPELSTAFSSQLPIPPNAVLPIELNRKLPINKMIKKQEKKDIKDTKPSWSPMELSKWQAILTHNPSHKMVRKATKCLTSEDWNTALQELVLAKAFERVEELKAKNMWSFRQPIRQKGPPVLKDHWAYLLDEMRWLQADFREERKWKQAVALELAEAAVLWHRTAPEERHKLCAKYVSPPIMEDLAESIQRGVPQEDEEVTDDEDLVMEEDEEAIPLPTAVAAPLLDAVEEIMDVDLAANSKSEEPSAPEPTTVPTFAMKIEEVESSLPASAESNTENEFVPKGESEQIKLRSEDQNPALADAGLPNLIVRDNHKQVRAPIFRLDSSALWVRSDELDQFLADNDPQVDEPPSKGLVPEPTLEQLFPELPPYTALPDAPGRHRKPDRRPDEIGTRSVPMSRFTHERPLVLSALQPVEHFGPNGWSAFDEAPISYREGKLEPGTGSELFPIAGTSVPGYISKAPSVSISKAPQWTSSEDAMLKQLADELHYNWDLVSDSLNLFRRSIWSDARTSEQCISRYETLWGSIQRLKLDENGAVKPEGEEQMELAATEDAGLSRIQTDVFAPSTEAPASDSPKMVRHRFVHRVLKKVMVRREESWKEKDINARLMPPHSSHEMYMKYPYKNPEELSREKRERDERFLAEQKRKHAEYLRFRAYQQAQIHGLAHPMSGMPTGHPPGQMPAGVNGQPFPSNAAPMKPNGNLPMRVNGPMPNISHQGNPAFAAAIQRGGDISQTAMLLLRQQQAAALGNGSPPRPGSAASIIQAGSGAPQGTPPQPHAMPNAAQIAALRAAQMANPANGLLPNGQPMTPEQQLYLHRQAQAMAQHAAAAAALSQNQQGS